MPVFIDRSFKSLSADCSPGHKISVKLPGQIAKNHNHQWHSLSQMHQRRSNSGTLSSQEVYLQLRTQQRRQDLAPWPQYHHPSLHRKGFSGIVVTKMRKIKIGVLVHIPHNFLEKRNSVHSLFVFDVHPDLPAAFPAVGKRQLEIPCLCSFTSCRRHGFPLILEKHVSEREGGRRQENRARLSDEPLWRKSIPKKHPNHY